MRARLHILASAVAAVLAVGCGAPPGSATPPPPPPPPPPAAPARVLLTFDDATSTAHSAAYPILKAAGMVATVFASGSLVGSDPWFMTLAELRELYEAGWDVGSHTWSHQALSMPIEAYSRSGPIATIALAVPHGRRPGDTVTIAGCDAADANGVQTVATVPDELTITFSAPGAHGDGSVVAGCRIVGGVDEATVHSELRQNREWLVEKGFLRAKDHLAFPYGAWDSSAIAIWRDMGGRTGRIVGPSATGSFLVAAPVEEESWYEIPSWDLNDRTTAAEALTVVDAAIAARATIVFLGHGVVPSNPYSTQIRASEFQGLVDGIASRRDAGDVDVLTISEWYAHAAR